MGEADVVQRFVGRKIKELGNMPKAQRAAVLAKLRRCVGKSPGASPEAWELTLAEMPENLTGSKGEPSYAEWAIHLALTLYAVHQQGKGETVNADDVSFGSAVSRLVAPDKSNENGIKRRFNSVLTVKDVNEFASHARGLVQLMKARDVTLDYPRFAKDIFDFQFADNQDRVKLRWGEDYYRVSFRSEDTPVGFEANNRDSDEE